jgi:D-amino-acid dehydrogenase
LRCAGIVEFGGLNAPRSQAPIDLLRKNIRHVYPDLTWDSEQVWMGFRPSTADSLLHLGSLRDAPSVICAFGGQHIGVTIGPKLGRMAADMVFGRRINFDLAPYDANRFG